MALDRFFNQDDVLSKQPVYGQDFDNGDQALLNANKVKVPFTQVDVTGIPGISNAVLEKHFYAGASLVASGESQITTIGDEQQGYTVYVKPEQDARAAGFNQGTYSVVYNFLHKLPNVKITEISGDRTEIKVTGVGPNPLGGLEQFAALYDNLPTAG